jgi:hypothetical protein
VLRGPPIQVVGVTLIIEFVLLILYTVCKGHIKQFNHPDFKLYEENLIHNENCKNTYSVKGIIMYYLNPYSMHWTEWTSLAFAV